MCNVPIQLNGEVLAAYLCEHGEVEDIIKPKSSNGTAHGDYFFTMSLNTKGFQAIPHTIEYECQVMTVIVEGKKAAMLVLQTARAFLAVLPTKNQQTNITTTDITSTDIITMTTTTTTITATETTKPTTEMGDHPNKNKKGGPRSLVASVTGFHPYF